MEKINGQIDEMWSAQDVGDEEVPAGYDYAIPGLGGTGYYRSRCTALEVLSSCAGIDGYGKIWHRTKEGMWEEGN